MWMFTGPLESEIGKQPNERKWDQENERALMILQCKIQKVGWILAKKCDVHSLFF